MEVSYPTMDMRETEVQGKTPGDKDDEDDEGHGRCWIHGCGEDVLLIVEDV